MLEAKLTAKTLSFDVLKETFTHTDLIGIEVGDYTITKDKAQKIYDNFRNSPRFKGTCYIFLTTLQAIVSELSDEEKKARAKEIVKEMKKLKGWLGSYDEGTFSNDRLRRTVELNAELVKLGY